MRGGNQRAVPAAIGLKPFGRSQGLDADEATWNRLDALEAFARRRGVELLDVAIGGLAAQPAAGSREPGDADLAELRVI